VHEQDTGTQLEQCRYSVDGWQISPRVICVERIRLSLDCLYKGQDAGDGLDAEIDGESEGEPEKGIGDRAWLPRLRVEELDSGADLEDAQPAVTTEKSVNKGLDLVGENARPFAVHWPLISTHCPVTAELCY